MSTPEFWADLGKRFAAVSHYGELRATKSEAGQWEITGNAHAVQAFYDLAGEGAKAKGFTGTPEQCVQYWLNLVKSGQAFR